MSDDECELGTVDDQLKRFGVKFKGKWDLRDRRMALIAFNSIADAFARVTELNGIDVFNHVFGGLNMWYGDGGGLELGNWYGKTAFPNMALKPGVITPQLIAHELGHAFQTQVYTALGKNVSSSPVNMLAAPTQGSTIADDSGNHVSGYNQSVGKYRRTMAGYGNCGLPCAYHPLSMEDGDSADEDFADMFMNWTFNSFDYSSDANGAGTARYNWVNENMATWISYIP